MHLTTWNLANFKSLRTPNAYRLGKSNHLTSNGTSHSSNAQFDKFTLDNQDRMID